MTTKHKHYDAIIAFANGETIQIKHPNGTWFDCSNTPGFSEEREYRVKPPKRTPYQVYCDTMGYTVDTSHSAYSKPGWDAVVAAAKAGEFDGD